ncbi:MAG: flagellar biosynthesis/type III secretory pathway chaperone [Gammaproteobacteria bacterium]|jgi:flagellar biosynthesis/type III secretory pathway chaperone
MNNHSQDQCRHDLIRLLQAQLDKVQEVNTFLVELKASIAQNDIDAINAFLSHDSLPISEIEALEGQRNKILATYGFQSNNNAQQECIAWCDDSDASLSTQFKLFTEALLNLQRSIQVNDLLVSKGQERIRRSVQLLTGKADSEGSSTYSKSGQTRTGTDKRSITRA